MSREYRYIGKSIPIHDAALKVSGQMKYIGDIKLPNMLHAKMLLSPIAHARIKRIDLSRAEALPGVRAVACYLNAPQVPFNSAMRFYEHKIPENELIFSDTMRFIGDRVAAVAADTPEIAAAAVSLIGVEYEELPAVFDPEEALKEDAPEIHPGGNKASSVYQNAGNVDEAFKEADFIYEDRYTTPAVHHGALELHAAIADYDFSGKLTVYSPNQNIFAFRIILSRVLDIPFNKLRVVRTAIGGSFGGKLEATLEPVVALLAKMCVRPVKLELNRSECMFATRTRHASVLYLKTGVMKDGTIVAQDMKMITNTGAYASSCYNVLSALSHKVFKMYKCPNMRFTGIPAYTNLPIAGAMRGYGSPQAFFGQQLQMRKIAAAQGIDLVDLQLKNLVEPDSTDPRFGTSNGNPRPIDCVKIGADAFGWYEKPLSRREGKYLYGKGMAMGAHGNGLFGAHRDVIALFLKMNEDGSAILHSASHDMGNGVINVQKQIVAEILGIDIDLIMVNEADTEVSPWNLGDYASRGTYTGGNCAIKVASAVKEQIVGYASLMLEENPQNIILKDNQVISSADPEKKASMGDLVVYTQKEHQAEIMAAETFASAHGVTSYGAHFAEVRVDTETGAVEVLDYVAAHDIGKALNPMGVEGQIEGAIQMGIGYALTESLDFNDKGKLINQNLKRYHMYKASEMPGIRVLLVEDGEVGGPFGGKSIGECSVVPVGPAVANAVLNALGAEHNDMPLRPDVVMELIKNNTAIGEAI